MISLSSQEEIEKIADQSTVELLPIHLDEDDDEPAKKSDVGSHHSDDSHGLKGIGDVTDTDTRETSAKDRRKPRTPLIQV